MSKKESRQEMIKLNCPACGESFTDETVLGANVKLVEHMSALLEIEHVEQLPTVQAELSRQIGETGSIGNELFALVAQFDARLHGIQRMAALDLRKWVFALRSLKKTCGSHIGIRDANHADALQRQLGDALRIVEQKIR
jgi:hypothetical protein